MSYTEINLQKENIITAASIQLGQDKRNVLQIQIKALLSSKWVHIVKPFKVKTWLQYFLLFPVFFCSGLWKSDKVKYENLTIK